MWKIFFTYRDKSKCTVKGKGTITPGLVVQCYYRYGLHAAESIYQQYPKCPFFKSDSVKGIRCEGMSGTKGIRVLFDSEEEKNRYEEEYCLKYPNRCKHAEMMEKEY